MALTVQTVPAEEAAMGRVYIGTSGWNYPHWKNSFYAGVPRGDWLRYSASRFTGIEVNATFYGLQRRATFERWAEQVPAAFRFAIKGNRYLTHTKRLLEPDEPIRRERERAAGLGDKLAVVLWQLPGNFSCHLERLQAFVEALQSWSEVAHVIEFRHRSWFQDRVAACLAKGNVGVCMSDAADWPLWDAVTARTVYVRLHGHTRTYASRYSTRLLTHWAERVRAWSGKGRDVHVYFDNDAEGAAPRDALRLLALVGAPADA
jgi:uncharacterized protein YecE (DUF72 family)